MNFLSSKAALLAACVMVIGAILVGVLALAVLMVARP